MSEFQQALWGYSNGHHLLASSIILSSASVKTLEMLTDLSGVDVYEDFDGYLTGYPLKAERKYAISKTWYAPEMPRPGCVWTHTIFVDFDDMLSISTKEFDELFHRPGKILDTEEYTHPILFKGIESSPKDIYKFNIENSCAFPMMRLMFGNWENTIISSDNCAKYNTAIESLIIGLGVRFFGDTSFCTGVFANRSINKRQLNIQITPNNLCRIVLRTADRNTAFYEDIINNATWQPAQIKEVGTILRFLSLFDQQFWGRKYLYLFSRLYYLMSAKNSSLKNMTLLLDEGLPCYQRNIVITRVIELIFNKAYQSYFANKKIDVLFEILTTSVLEDNNYELSENLLYSMLRGIWEESHKNIFEILTGLTQNSINNSGENAIKELSTIISDIDYPNLLAYNVNAYLVLLQVNYRLGSCRDLWRKGKDIQLEALKLLGQNLKTSDLESEAIHSILCVVYDESQYDISAELYDVFGDHAISSFFIWAAKDSNSQKVKLWANICKYNASLSIKELKNVLQERIFSAVIGALDPYNMQVVEISSTTWESLYRCFCQYSNDSSTKERFAKFILPVILQSAQEFSPAIQKFAFNAVHKLLAENLYDYYEWEKLSQLLPDVAWYNSWDKCKRLRKAAKFRNIKIEYENHT